MGKIPHKYFTRSKIFLYIMLAFCTGIFIASAMTFNQSPWQVIVITVCIILLVTLFFYRIPLVTIVSLSGIFFLIGMGYTASYKLKHFPNTLPYNQKIIIKGYVSEEPETKNNTTKIILKVNQSNDRTLLSQNILVSLPVYPEYKYGDVLKIEGNLEKPEKINDFDYKSYLSRYLIFSLIKHPTNVEYINNGAGDKLYYFLFNLKNRFVQSIKKILPEPVSSLASGLVVGAANNFPDDLNEDMKATGTTHIVVISGQNMEIVSKVFVELTKYWSRSLTFCSGAAGLGLFSILTGASASVVRAAILASLFLWARYVGREKNILNPLILTGTVMILFNPLIMRYDIGFQLSFMAMLGLIYVTPMFEKIFSKMPKVICEPLAATLGAQVATMPILLYNFGRLSIIAPVTNVLILSVVPYAMTLSFIAGIAGIISYKIGLIFAWITWPLLEYGIKIIQIFAKIPHVLLTIDFHFWLYPIVYYIIIISLVIHWGKKNVKK